MRTPKHKRIMQKAKTSATNKLRKKAMKNKMMKKTMLDIGGDDTRDEVRDLMNESDLSLVGVDFKEQLEAAEARTTAPAAGDVLPASEDTKTKEPVTSKVSGMMSKSLSMVTMKANETSDKISHGIMKKTKSLRSLRTKRKLSNEENIDKNQEEVEAEGVSKEKRTKVEDIKEPLESAEVNLPSLTLPEQALAKFAGVKNILSSAVWGVPYAKVMEDPLEISVCEPEVEPVDSKEDVMKGESNANNCVIS